MNKYLILFREACHKLEEKIYNIDTLSKQAHNRDWKEKQKKFADYGITNDQFINILTNKHNEAALENRSNLAHANIGMWTDSGLRKLADINLRELNNYNLIPEFNKLKASLYSNDSNTIAMIKMLYKFNNVYGFNGNL